MISEGSWSSPYMLQVMPAIVEVCLDVGRVFGYAEAIGLGVAMVAFVRKTVC